MLEAILGVIATIGMSVVGNFITLYLQGLTGYKPPSIPDINVTAEKRPEPENLEQWRAKNRKKLGDAVDKVYFHVFSYFAMYMAFYVPIVFAGGLTNIRLNLINSRIGIDYLITSNNLSTICAVFGVLVFFPFWKLSEVIASLLSKVFWHFTSVNDLKKLAFTVLTMVFWAFFVAGNISYLLNPNITWFTSIKFSLMLCGLLFCWTFASKK